MTLYNKSDLSHSVFASQGYGHKYVFPCACAVALIELCSIFLCLKPGDTTHLLQSPRGRLWAHQIFFTYSVDTPAIFSLHFQIFMPLHLKKLHDSISSGPIFPPSQGLCHSETAFLPPSTSTSTQITDAWSHNQLSVCPATKDLKVMVFIYPKLFSNCIWACFQAQNRLSLLLNHSRSPSVVLAPANLHSPGVFLGRVQELEHSSSHSKQFACSHPVLPGQGAAQSAQGCFLPDGLHARPSPDIFNLLA